MQASLPPRRELPDHVVLLGEEARSRGRGREEHAGRIARRSSRSRGVGTLDEIFEVLALLQLRRIGSAHPVPFVVMNYDGCYDGLLQFLERDMVRYGSLRENELAPHWRACRTNEEALAYLVSSTGSRVIHSEHSGSTRLLS